jgi:exopolysaccharide biosynthesis polyprenyl glycosylphosphotransferase
VAQPVVVRPRYSEGRPRRTGRYGYDFRRFVVAADLVAIALSIALVTALDPIAGAPDAAHTALMVAFVPLWVLLAQGVGLYHVADRRLEHSFVDDLAPVLIATTIWIWLIVLADELLPLADRLHVLLAAALWLAIIALSLGLRAAARAMVGRRDWFRRSAVVIGDAHGIDQVLARILRHPEWRLDVVAALRPAEQGVILERREGVRVRYGEALEATNGADEMRPGDIAHVVDDLGADRAIVAGGLQSLTERTNLIRGLIQHGIGVDYVSGEPETLYSAAVLHHLEGLPVLSVRPTRLTRTAASSKRVVDISISTTALVVLAPLFAFAAIGTRLSSLGPVLFRQQRVGRHGECFEMLKFRTMVDGADTMRDQVRPPGNGNGNGGRMLKLRDDPRVTRFGARLRRWSIDELPQLWNVLRGDMSLVGPRPLPLDEAPLVKGHWVERMRMRPGITGPWQTHGRSDIPFEDMVKLDFTYVVGWSMREDLRLLLRTAGAVIRRHGAY